MRKKKSNNFVELDQVTHFKMYKNGKMWVTSGICKTMLWLSSFNNRKSDLSSGSNKVDGLITNIPKGIVAISTLFGGTIIAANDIFADDGNVAKEKSNDEQDTIVEKNQVTIPKITVHNVTDQDNDVSTNSLNDNERDTSKNSESNSVDSGSTSTSISESLSSSEKDTSKNSESNSVGSESTSPSVSESLSSSEKDTSKNSESNSVGSESTSPSVSESLSSSEIDTSRNSESGSVGSESTSTSVSESLSSSEIDTSKNSESGSVGSESTSTSVSESLSSSEIDTSKNSESGSVGSETEHSKETQSLDSNISENIESEAVTDSNTLSEYPTRNTYSVTTNNAMLNSNLLAVLKTLEKTNSGFSVNDPEYPSGMPRNSDNENKYDFEWLTVYSGSTKVGDISVSIDRNGSGQLYIQEISTNGAKKQLTLGQSTASISSSLFSKTTYYYDGINGNYSLVVKRSSGALRTNYVGFVADSSGNAYGTVTNFVPKNVNQNTTYVDEEGKPINDSDNVTQNGWTGQTYTTSSGQVINGYYSDDVNDNGNGTMSQFGEIGAKYEKNYHDGTSVIYTQLDGIGTMQADVYRNGVKSATYSIPVGQTVQYVNSNTTYNIRNPYIQQTQDIQYQYKKLGNLIIKDEDGTILNETQYVNDSTDATKAYYPDTLVDKPGYVITAKDSDGNIVDINNIKNGDKPASLSVDTIVTYEKDPVSMSTSESVSGSTSLSTSESLSGSTSLSTSESLSGSTSLSTSESLSGSTSLSTSESLSGSTSLSTSESLSGSTSLSTSESVSSSESVSTSESVSGSESVSTSESVSGS
ncbi:KxYKxGKxW signal peptide domain-containing protein, partial [Leuconostoc fallax]|uniref:KxYKxGKxW signal peptide domain-containing protein n=2 Tax=Leuconostoc fallax TaxID=1251 RepID=UPI001C1EA81F|nr:KxYKxGKxW signal peptide domain-containing protein [Leuconostoc fallax]